MHRKKINIAIPASVLIAAVSAIMPVYAGGPGLGDIQRAIQQTEQIQIEQQNRLEQQRREALETKPFSGTEIEVPEAPVDSDDTQCRDIREIEIEGATLLSKKERQDIISPYLDTCMSVGDIEKLLSDLMAYYVEKGYISARTYLQPQDLAEGTLNILVIEGVVEEILLNDEGGKRNVNLFTAFPALIGAPFNLRDFEQGLDQINRLPSNNAQMDIAPGEKAGGSVIIIRNSPARRIRGTASYDNYGNTSTGESQLGLGVSLDNPLAINDSFYYSHRRTTGDDIGRRHSRSHLFLYSVPIGYFSFTGSFNYSDYATTINLQSGEIIADGDSKTSALASEYVAYRDAINRVAFSATLSAKTFNNFLNDQFLTVSSRKLSTLDIGSTWSTRLLGGAFGSNLNYVQGLRLFGALDDPTGLPDDLPRAQYKKIMVGASWYKPFMLGEQNMAFSSTFSGQIGFDVLYGSEQLFIGGVYSVRGFRYTSISGDTGYYLRNDLSMPIFTQIMGQGVLIKPYIGYDVGNIRDRNAIVGGHLAGVTGGVTLNSSRFNLDVMGFAPVSIPDALEDEGFQVFAKVSLNL